MGNVTTQYMALRFLTLLSFCVIYASASAPLYSLATSGLDQGRRQVQFAQETVENALGLRRSSLTESCSQITQLSSSQIQTQLQQAGSTIPASCIVPMFDFMKDTLCSDSCKNSPLLANLTNSRRSANRQLLGGTPGDPASSCSDPCFSPFTTGMIKVMKVIMAEPCKSAFASGSRRAVTAVESSRQLLGGATSSYTDQEVLTAMELSFGLLCSKNAAGSYCLSLYDQLKVDDTTGWDGSSSCLMSTSVRTQVESLGCCWGNVVVLSGSAASASDAAFVAQFTSMASACSITLTSTPCSSSITMSSVESTVSLAGVLLSEFEGAKENQFIQGVATTAGVSKKLVAVTQKTATSRRSGVQVKSTVTLTGDAASNQASVESALANQASLQSNIQSAGLSAATVSSTTSSSGFSVSGTASSGSSGSSSGLSTGAVVGIVIVCVVVVAAAIAGVVFFVMKSGSSSANQSQAAEPVPDAAAAGVEATPAAYPTYTKDNGVNQDASNDTSGNVEGQV